MTTATATTKRFPAGPRGLPLIGNMRDFMRDPRDFLTRCAREYGDVVSIRILNIPVYLLNHPDYIEQVLVIQNRNFAKTPGNGAERMLLGNGLVTSDGEFWLRQRRLVQPAFHRERLAAYSAVMAADAERTIASWQEHANRDIHEDMMRLTLEIVVRTLFDAEIGPKAKEIGTALGVLMEEIGARMGNPIQIPMRIPTPGNLRYSRAIARLDAVIYDLIRQRRADRADRGDPSANSGQCLLSMLLHAQDEDGSQMTDRQLRDEVMTMFIAGHETTALALTWAWCLLAQHPAVEARLVEELQTVLGGRSPTVADVPRLRYTEMIVKEAMRLYPPAWMVDGRLTLEDCEIGGYHVPAKTIVAMSQWVMHRDPRYFAEPETFNPSRWDGDLAKQLPKFAYFPFGGGPRLCIGHAFAMIEAVLLLATIAQRVHFTLVPGQTIVPMTSITLRPKNGVRVVVNKR